MDYQLELKQIVDYPRCRIYREFVRSLMEDRDIRTNGSSYLFYYMTLCSYANTIQGIRQAEVYKTYSFPKSYVSYRKPRAIRTEQRERVRQMIIEQNNTKEY